MPVVTSFSDIASPTVAADPARARGRPIKSVGNVLNLSTDSQLSKYKLEDLPSEAILQPGTFFKVDLWGYADIRIGTFTDPAALVSVLRSAGALVTPIANGDARHGQPLWQALGLAADPGGVIGIWAHGSVAAPTGAGSMRFALDYLHR